MHWLTWNASYQSESLLVHPPLLILKSSFSIHMMQQVVNQVLLPMLLSAVKSMLLAGINAGLYSRELMENCTKFVAECQTVPETGPDQILIRSAAKAYFPGSSTVLVAFFDGQV